MIGNEAVLGPVPEEEDLALMRAAGEDNAAVSTTSVVNRGQKDGEDGEDEEDGEDGEDEEDEEDELLLDLMDGIDDELMYAAMRRRGPEEADRAGTLGGLKPGFLKGATPKSRPPPPVVVGDVRERHTTPAGAPAPATQGEAEKPVFERERKPVSRFKMSLHR